MRYAKLIELLKNDISGLERQIKVAEAEISNLMDVLEVKRANLKNMDAELEEWKEALFIISPREPLDSVEKDAIKV